MGSGFIEQALEILGSVPLIDGHNDWPHLIRGFYDNKLDRRFQRESNLAGHVDIKRLKEGRSGGAFWSVYIDCPDSDDFTDDAIHFEALRDTIQQIDLVHRLLELYPDDMGLIEDSSDIMRLFKASKFSSLIGVEGLHQIANSVSVLRMYYKLGVRYVTLAHNKNNIYADSATSSSPAHGGLSAQGIDMIREMNRIGIASIVPHVRNVSDAVLKKLQANNGVIMVTFIPSLIHTKASEASIDHIIDHIIYAGDLIGYNHIGLGSDYDGMFSAVKGVDDVSLYPDLVAKMLERGISRPDVEMVVGLNIIRVLEEVEARATKLKSQSAVMEDEVKQLWNDNFRATVESVYPHAEKGTRIT
ncbi:Peptidase M19 renal dipeptidase [Penicillium solitum]|uniref:Peptidase M19 renal dipeptidase n=1 Tax=Penicillium solitum TaxID=60172 RepID=UPI0032C3D875|nr:Peptidase M19 renal dipeptidase [Penicillium solitum]